MRNVFKLGNLYLSMQDSSSINFYKKVLNLNSENRLAGII